MRETSVMQLLGNNMVKLEKGNQPKYAFINCDERVHISYNYETLFKGQFIENNESWQFYKAFENELPSEEDLKHLKGIIIPGSHNSAYNEKIEWIGPLKNFLKNVFDNHKHIKMLGVCFGHQIFTEALGGKVEKMAFLEQMKVPVFLGKEKIQLKDSFLSLPYV